MSSISRASKPDRGYAKTDQYFSREPGDFVIAIAELFSFREDWHQDDRARPLIRQLNRKRSLSSGDSPCDVHAPPTPLGQSTPLPSDSAGVNSFGVESASESASREVLGLASPSENLGLPLEGLLLDEATLLNSPILPYVRMVASVIERGTIGRDELIAALRKRMRQRSIGRRPRREYILCYLNQHPP